MKANKLVFLPFIALSLVSCGGGNEPVSTTTSETPSTTSSESKDIQEVIKTIAEVNRMDHGVPVELKARVIAINKTMAIIYDGTGSLNVYAGFNHTFKVDDKYLFEGNTVLYNGVHQLEKETMTFSPTTGDIAEFDYTPTEITTLDTYDGKVGVMVKIKGEVCYTDGNYYNSDYLPGDTELALSISAYDNEYLSEFNNTDKNYKVVLDITGMLVGVVYASSQYSTSRANIILTEKAVDTSIEVKELTISDSMAEFYNENNVFSNDNKLVAEATYSNNASVKLLNNKYQIEVKKDGNTIDPQKPFGEVGDFNVTVTYRTINKSYPISVCSKDVITINESPNSLADKNDWDKSGTSTKYYKDAMLDSNVKINIYGSSAGAYSPKNNSWTALQKGTKADPVGRVEISLIDEVSEKYEITLIKITFSPNEGDDDSDRYGHFSYNEKDYESDETMAINGSSATLLVVGKDSSITNAVIRIKNIIVRYQAVE